MSDFWDFFERISGVLSARFRGIPKVISGAIPERFREYVRGELGSFKIIRTHDSGYFAIGYDTPRINSWKRYYREKKLPRNRTLEPDTVSGTRVCPEKEAMFCPEEKA